MEGKNMKHVLLIIIILFSLCLFSSRALGAPFLVCNSQSGVTRYELTGPAWIPASSPAQPDGSMRLDVANALVGDNPLTVKACNMWGCSAAVNFILIRPVGPSSPANIKLVP